MYVKLHAVDREAILDYISREPEPNVFIAGDLENYGVDSETVEFFADSQDSGWDCLVMRYRRMFIVYSHKERYDVQATADFIARFDAIECISGKGSVVEQLAPCFPQFEATATYLCSCGEPLLHEPVLPQGYVLRRLIPDDAVSIIGLYLQIQEFAHTYQGKGPEKIDLMRSDLMGEKTGYGIFKDNSLVSVALTTAETSQSAMIVGVATHIDHRKQHLATIVMNRLLKEQFSKGKQFLCLFYNNPEAGRIYHKCGFREIGSYVMLRPPLASGPAE